MPLTYVHVIHVSFLFPQEGVNKGKYEGCYTQGVYTNFNEACEAYLATCGEEKIPKEDRTIPLVTDKTSVWESQHVDKFGTVIVTMTKTFLLT